ncbi:MAG: GDSL-type esterase/lipase family protein [Candidatus Ornithomonoglobus sp.]
MNLKKKLGLLCAAAGLGIFQLASTAYAGACNGIADGITVFFDFGNSTIYGWYNVDATTVYSQDMGFGFNTTQYNRNVAASGSECQTNAVRIDAAHLGEVSFDVDVDPGMYEVCVYSGDIENMGVKLEGHPAMVNLLYSKACQQAEIPVTDGQLNISLMENFSGNKNFDISGITVKRTGDISTRKKRVFICGDSLASEYHPEKISGSLSETVRGGWGQMLKYYIPGSLYVHNLSIPGETSTNFIDKGQLDSVLYFMQPGDYALISYGTNDYSLRTPQEFKDSMGTIIDTIKDAGGIPIVISETIKLDDFNKYGEYIYSDVCYAQESSEVAGEHGVLYIDNHARCGWYFSSIGYKQTCKMFWNAWGTRNLIHPNREGAGHIARLITEQCIDSGVSEFAGVINTYGLSPDIRLKCITEGDDRVILVNTTSEKMTYSITTIKYENEVPVKTYTEKLTLPAYDVRNADNEYIFETELNNPNKRVYVEGNGIKFDL